MLPNDEVMIKKAKIEDIVSTDPVQMAENAGLIYMNDRKPGIRRKLKGDHFVFFGVSGKAITDEKEIKRIRALAVPPAYKDVWICPKPNGHLQATGIDAKGRKQYRYHARWREVSDETKYNKMIAFANALPSIRKRIKKDIALTGMPKEKVLAAVVHMLEITLIRVGNEEYARDNKSFGLTTFRNRHVDVEGTKVSFKFRGKSGQNHTISFSDRRLAKIVKQCRDIPGQDLFEYLNEDGEPVSVTSTDVNEYLNSITQEHFTAKDFRTWAGTVLAVFALQEFEHFDSEVQAKKNIVQAIEKVAKKLGNTPSVCRKCYIHPEVITAYLDGQLLETIKQRAEQELIHELSDLTPEEAAVLAFLQLRLEIEIKKSKK